VGSGDGLENVVLAPKNVILEGKNVVPEGRKPAFP
jgi:hypothetical protein